MAINTVSNRYVICDRSTLSLVILTVVLANLVFVFKTADDTKFVTENNASDIQEKFVGLILARGGSKGLRKKNLAIVNGRTLLARSLQAMKQFGKFNEIWVSTDNTDIAAEAEREGTLVHNRSIVTATDLAPSILGVTEFLNNHTDVMLVGLIQCTSPFLKAQWLQKAYNKITQEDYDAVFSVSREKKFRWKLNGGSAEPLNFDPENRPRRQDWSGELVENGMFYFTTANLIRQGTLQGGRIGCVEVPSNHSLEIDSAMDLTIANALAPLLDNL